jgi:hypothetical protein
VPVRVSVHMRLCDQTTIVFVRSNDHAFVRSNDHAFVQLNDHAFVRLNDHAFVRSNDHLECFAGTYSTALTGRGRWVLGWVGEQAP